MNAKYSLEQIRAFWTQQAIDHKQSPAASWSDRMVIEMEGREIVKHLTDGDRVLDIGCGNGYSTVQFAAKRRINILGVDYIPAMIEEARRRLSNLADDVLGTIEFKVGDITALDELTEQYDKVIVIRVLINLGDDTSQAQALAECARVLKPGGLLLLSEATLKGWERLNSFRHEWGLPDIPVPPFNQYVDEE